MSSDGEQPKTASAESELAKERTFGGEGIEAEREIRQIDLSDYETRLDDIADQVWSAALDIGFFQVINHGIDQHEIDRAFRLVQEFFSLPADLKSTWPLRPGTNSGWEDRTQVRPSTGTQDQKESYQITAPRMDRLALWPTDEQLPGFRTFMLSFEQQNHRLGMRLLRCFAVKLGFEHEFFSDRHDPASPEHQCTLRLLHYLPMAVAADGSEHWRAGAHTDYDCLTLLHQVTGQDGLQVCPGNESGATSNGSDASEGARKASGELTWTAVEPIEGTVTCNIGDMLMRWSDDLLPSTLHRVRMPRPGEYDGPRFSMGYFCQADGDAIIQGPAARYEPIRAADYLRQRIAANFAG